MREAQAIAQWFLDAMAARKITEKEESRVVERSNNFRVDIRGHEGSFKERDLPRFFFFRLILRLCFAVVDCISFLSLFRCVYHRLNSTVSETQRLWPLRIYIYNFFFGFCRMCCQLSKQKRIHIWLFYYVNFGNSSAEHNHLKNFFFRIIFFCLGLFTVVSFWKFVRLDHSLVDRKHLEFTLDFIFMIFAGCAEMETRYAVYCICFLVNKKLTNWRCRNSFLEFYLTTPMNNGMILSDCRLNTHASCVH